MTWTPGETMNERPIKFNAEMVRAILDGRKTQTRRVIKPQPAGEFLDNPYLRRLLITEKGSQGWRCPYGKPGDVLWVREKWAAHYIWDGVSPSGIKHDDGGACVFYAADGGIIGGCQEHQRSKVWRASIHMPRWASRITLEVTDVRVERVQDVSPGDCLAEGVGFQPCPCVRACHEDGRPMGLCDVCSDDARTFFRDLWDSIYDANGFGWSANPWVWVVCFKVVTS